MTTASRVDDRKPCCHPGPSAQPNAPPPEEPHRHHTRLPTFQAPPPPQEKKKEESNQGAKSEPVSREYDQDISPAIPFGHESVEREVSPPVILDREGSSQGRYLSVLVPLCDACCPHRFSPVLCVISLHVVRVANKGIGRGGGGRCGRGASCPSYHRVVILHERALERGRDGEGERCDPPRAARSLFCASMSNRGLSRPGATSFLRPGGGGVLATTGPMATRLFGRWSAWSGNCPP